MVIDFIFASSSGHRHRKKWNCVFRDLNIDYSKIHLWINHWAASESIVDKTIVYVSAARHFVPLRPESDSERWSSRKGEDKRMQKATSEGIVTKCEIIVAQASERDEWAEPIYCRIIARPKKDRRIHAQTRTETIRSWHEVMHTRHTISVQSQSARKSLPSSSKQFRSTARPLSLSSTLSFRFTPARQRCVEPYFMDFRSIIIIIISICLLCLVNALQSKKQCGSI